MKRTIWRCDGCGKETEYVTTCRLPIIITTSNGHVLELHDIDLCERCANDISKAYYDIAESHSFSGVRGIRLNDEEETA